jgi:AcrR family transcriptional regulator
MDDNDATVITLKSRQRLVNRRGAATRSRLLEAAVGCLARLGYAATTIEAVMVAAEASRGSVLHQFPTRLDLMEAAADSAMHRMLADFQSRLDEVADPAARLTRIPDIAWGVQNEAAAFAVSEILLAARWDRALAERLRPVAERIDRELDAYFTEVARQAGVGRPAEIVAPMRLMISSLRGLTIELMFDSLRPTILKALEILKSNHLVLIDASLRPVERAAMRRVIRHKAKSVIVK